MAEFAYSIELWNGSTRSEILNNKIESCSWIFNRVGGCDECNIILKAAFSDYSSIILGSTWKIKIFIRFEGESVYRQLYIGTILTRNKILEISEKVELRAVGYLQQLQKVVIFQNPITGEPSVFSTVAVSDIVDNLLTNYIQPYTDIPDHHIAASSITPESITFDTTALQAIQLLGTLAGNYEWGVRGDGEFYFTPKSTTVKPEWNFFLGQPGLTCIDNPEDASDITNRIYFSGAEGLECILEDENNVTNVQQIVNDTTYSFGKSTTYQDLLQTFTGFSSLKTLILRIKKTGFTDLIIDGDMETTGTANWPNYGPRPGTKEKKLYEVGGSDHFLYADPKGNISGFHQEVDSLTGEYLLSFKYRAYSKSYPMKLQIFNLTTNAEIFYKASYNSKSWIINETITFEVGTDEDIDIRFMGAKIYLDNVKLLRIQDDMEVQLVTAADPDTEIKAITINGSEITSSAADFKLDFTIDNLNPPTSYGFRIKRTGDLSDTSYYLIDGANSDEYANGTLKYYDGTWHDLGKDAYFIMSYSTSQGTYRIKSERIKNSSISNVSDAQLWVNAYLSGKNISMKTATLSLISKTHFFDYEPQVNGAAIPLVSIRETGDSPSTKIQYLINQIQYTITDAGLLIQLELGTKQKKITDYLAWLEWQIEQLGMGTGGGAGGTVSSVMVAPPVPSLVTGLGISDESMWVDSVTGETHPAISATFNQNASNEYIDAYEISWEEFDPE